MFCEHAVDVERLYLNVNIFGKSILGFLDSGASRTINGNKGLSIIHESGLTVSKEKNSSCTVANGGRCQSLGVVYLLFT